MKVKQLLLHMDEKNENLVALIIDGNEVLRFDPDTPREEIFESIKKWLDENVSRVE